MHTALLSVQDLPGQHEAPCCSTQGSPAKYPPISILGGVLRPGWSDALGAGPAWSWTRRDLLQPSLSMILDQERARHAHRWACFLLPRCNRKGGVGSDPAVRCPGGTLGPLLKPPVLPRARRLRKCNAGPYSLLPGRWPPRLDGATVDMCGGLSAQEESGGRILDPIMPSPTIPPILPLRRPLRNT